MTTLIMFNTALFTIGKGNFDQIAPLNTTQVDQWAFYNKITKTHKKHNNKKIKTMNQ